MSVGEGNEEIVIVHRDESIRTAASMRRYHVGDVVVGAEHSEKRIPVGILTDRDLIVKVLA